MYKSKQMKKTWQRVLLYFLMILVGLFIILPVVWTVISSFKPEQVIMSYPPQWIPRPVTLGNYARVLSLYPYFCWSINSLITAISGTLLILATASMAAYALGRLHFRGRNLIYHTIIMMLLIPIQAYAVPLYLLSNQLGLLNSYAGIILPSAANVTSVFILTAFFRSLPNELEEAAHIDGCGEFRIFFSIMLPLSKPALSTVTILTFISNWNSFLWPMIALRSKDMLTLPVGIAQTVGSVSQNAQFEYGTALAACCMAVIPTLIVFFALQKYFVEGIASSGIKG